MRVIARLGAIGDKLTYSGGVQIAVLCLLSATVLAEALLIGQGRQGSAGQGAQAARPEDNRPPVFFREEWRHQFDRGGPPEGPVGQEHVSHPDLELKLYGEAPKGDTAGSPEHHHAGMWMNKRFANDPAHLFTGTCNRPCAGAFSPDAIR